MGFAHEDIVTALRMFNNDRNLAVREKKQIFLFFIILSKYISLLS